MTSSTVLHGFGPRAERYIAAAQEHVRRSGSKGVLSVEPGVRYARIVQTTGGSRSVYAFIDMTNGNVLTADSWKKPTKRVVDNIFTGSFGQGDDVVQNDGGYRANPSPKEGVYEVTSSIRRARPSGVMMNTQRTDVVRAASAEDAARIAQARLEVEGDEYVKSMYVKRISSGAEPRDRRDKRSANPGPPLRSNVATNRVLKVARTASLSHVLLVVHDCLEEHAKSIGGEHAVELRGLARQVHRSAEFFLHEDAASARTRTSLKRDPSKMGYANVRKLRGYIDRYGYAFVLRTLAYSVDPDKQFRDGKRSLGLAADRASELGL